MNSIERRVMPSYNGFCQAMGIVDDSRAIATFSRALSFWRIKNTDSCHVDELGQSEKAARIAQNLKVLEVNQHSELFAKS